MVAAVTVKQFETAYRNLLVSAPAHIGIARDNGALLILVPELADSIGKTVPGFSQMESAGPHRQGGYAETPSYIPGHTALTAYSYITQQPLMVFASFDREALTQRWLDEAMPQLAAGIAATLVTLLIAAWLRHLMRLKVQETEHVRAALEEANAANDAKRRFLANMSHELRTPLNAILGFSEVISGAIFGPLETHYRTYGGDIHKSGQHLLHLVDQLLDISRIESGALPLKMQPCHLDAIVDEALTLTRGAARDLGLSYRIDIADDARSFQSDRGILRQIIINLLTNAAKYNRPGGNITVEAQRVAAGILLVITDTGLGIAATDLTRIFEPFTRGDAWVARDTVEGTGLGLPIVRALIERLGGTVELTSTEHVGTRVEIHLPDAALPLERAG